MARQIVTQTLVTEAAEALIAEGAEPSIVTVQSRVGGGSYSTVKRYLDVWRQQRAQAATEAPETPLEVQAKGQEFARVVWALAAREAQRVTQKAKDDAFGEVASVRGELAEASTEIARLEVIESEQAAAIEQHQSRIRDAELALAEAQTQARRVPELENTLANNRAELDAVRKEATTKAVEAGRLAGEADALRVQVRELMAALKPQKAGK
jgi:chromosome segregation ATPase